MEYTTKLLYQSNYWYNDGLGKARIRDMSGAIASLKKSLQYNRANVASMNLLGLVYYGRGDVVEALVEWIISKNFQPQDNIADYYISKMQETPGELEEINQAVKRYNQSLQYAAQNGEDLAIIQLKKAVAAHPSYMKAYQLLGFLYLHTEQLTSARQMLRSAYRLDTTNELTLRYIHELSEIRRERPVHVKREDRKDGQTVTYNLGNETIIQPVSTSFKENAGIHTIINIGIGVLMGVLVMWFLIMPAMNASRQRRLNEQTVAFSDQIESQKSQINALKTELDGFRSTSEATENAQATAASTQESYEAVLYIYYHYQARDMSNATMVEELLKVNPDSLGEQGRGQYDEMAGDLFPSMCEDLYSQSQANYEVANYDAAVTNLEMVMSIDEGYASGEAMLLLAHSYAGRGEQDQANLLYQKIVESYPDTQAAASAAEEMAAQQAAQEAAAQEAAGQASAAQDGTDG